MEVGIDIVSLERIEVLYSRYGVRFLEKILLPEEVALCLQKPQIVASVAGRFAAKEAIVKALGSGFAQGVHWKSFAILNDAAGRPYVKVIDDECLPPSSVVKLSISHDRHSAVAVAIIE
uniref:Holo-[acyl-carrier-protein] synthase n=1 Tax=Chlorobium chlorochromatii (strain CaD3) TaxID=340177 RepID=ACPS_CHLCH|nr:RecName: Full=Holo-[acyl-carrier-protein] synthase; Short=Holo-ACP synthase; AltName: Full=4'-phosphopantetheinyl transferase AcpS [Chlorobium chlorochromatii CaD3]